MRNTSPITDPKQLMQKNANITGLRFVSLQGLHAELALRGRLETWVLRIEFRVPATLTDKSQCGLLNTCFPPVSLRVWYMAGRECLYD